MPRFISIGEIMVEMAPDQGDLFRLGYAGDTFNTAWYARRLLPEPWRVGYVTRLGQDAVSEAVTNFIAGEGIDTTGITYESDRTVGLYMIQLAQGERSFSYWRGQSAAKRLADDPDALAAHLDGAEVIYLSGITLAILSPERRAALCDVLARARAKGSHVAFDTNLRLRLWEDVATAREGLGMGASVADTVLPSFDEEHELFGDASPSDTIARYSQFGATTVVVKNGAAPCTAWQGGTEAQFSPIPAPQIDSTAAGDSFAAGFVASRALGYDLPQAVQTAMSLAARVVGSKGALVPDALTGLKLSPKPDTSA